MKIQPNTYFKHCRRKLLTVFKQSKSYQSKRLYVAFNKLHDKVDQALNMLSINTSVADFVIHEGHVDKVHHTVQLFQNDFTIATKFILLSKVVLAITSRSKQLKDHAAIYMSLLLAVIFLSNF